MSDNNDGNNQNMLPNFEPLPLAIGPPPASNENDNLRIRNLQGLLRFCMDATKAEDPTSDSAFQQLEEEKRKFLEEVFKSLSVDVIKILSESISTLLKAKDLSVDADITEQLVAFDNILEYVDNIDIAIDFYKVGGYEIFNSCFNSPHAEIRAKACDLLAELCQNNRFCQQKALENGFLKTLLELLDKDIDIDVNIKALYAISCLTRENLNCLEELKKLNGISSIMNALMKNNEKLTTKSCFLLTALCAKDQPLKDVIINMGCIELFITLLSGERKQSHEHILSVLLELVKNNGRAVNECQKSQYALESILQNHKNIVQNLPEAQEEKMYCEELLELLFNKVQNSVER